MIKKFNTIILSVFVVFLFFIFCFSTVKASITNGVIDTTYKWAWGEDIGWVNFGCDNCNVLVTDSAVTGYAWSNNYGWINLAPANGGVLNNCSGTLSGYAWAEGLGWIDFSGVTIDNNGYFQGYASSTEIGRISLNCDNTANCPSSDFKVRTDWRPCSARPQCNNTYDDDGDGKADFPNDPGCSSFSDNDETDQVGGGGGGGGASCPQLSNLSLKINNDDAITDTRYVTLNLTYENASLVVISENSNFSGAAYQNVYKSIPYILSAGEGEKTVYAKFKNSCSVSSTISDSIIYNLEGEEAEEEIEEEEIEPGTQTCTVECESLDYDLYIVNPDGSERHMYSSYTQVEALGGNKFRVSYEDKGSDFDYNDIVLELDAEDCGNVVVTPVSVNAGWHHEIKLRLKYNGVTKKDITLWQDSHESIDQTKTTNVKFYTDICETEEEVIETECEVDCNLVSYQLYIVNPDGTERYTNTRYVQAQNIAPGVVRYRFEDKGADFDYNDISIELDTSDCSEVIVKPIEVNAGWHHKIRLVVYYNGVEKEDILLWPDSHEAVNDQREINSRDNKILCSDLILPTRQQAEPTNGIIVYQDKNYQGASEVFSLDVSDDDLRNNLIANDTISSIKIFGSTSVTLYEHILYQGKSEILNESDPDLGDNIIGEDIISSLKVTAAGEAQPAEESATVNGCQAGIEFTAFMEIETVGEEVRELQDLLKCLGYFSKNVDSTGYYGPITQEAVINFQQDNGIEDLGYVGPQTRRALNKY